MAYAALFSLARTLTALDIREITQFEWDEIDSLRSTLRRLGRSSYRGIDRSEINELEAKIRDAAWKLQDVIELYQISQGLDDKGVEQEIHSFFNTAAKLREDYEKALENSWVAVAEEDDIIHDAANSTTVGLPDLSEEIITGLLDDESAIKMYTIWGVAGIGKTHLARDIYHHPLIVQHFDLRLWVSIGSKHRDIENIFVDILAQIESKPRDLFKGKNEDELKYLLGNSLLGRRYLVVIDDIWSISVWIDLINALPYNQNERGILITTRLYQVAEVWEGNKIWQVPLLSNEESWDLLSQNVFAEKPFPTQLEKLGRKIAEICEGLPLLILTVADILRGLEQTEECWKRVAEKKTTTFPDAYDRIYKVLVSSYDYLPQPYKACFLYMAVFRQGQEITLSKLTEMWFVEDLHEDDTFKVLFSSSLAIICKHRSQNRIKSCKLHSVYWYVCVTEARKNELFHVLIKLTDLSIERPRRLSVQNNMLFGVKEVYDSMAAATLLTRSLLFTGEDHPYPVPICFNTMLLLKVLAALAIRFYEFPNEVSNLLQLRYLALTHNGELPSSLSKLQRLQILILRRHHNIKLVQRDSTTCLPNEIWDLEELLHLRIMGCHLPNPDSSRGVKLSGLSILYVNADSCTEGVFRSLPHLDKLAIEIELQPEAGAGAESLRCMELTWLLDKLQSIKCVVVNPQLSSQVVAPPNHLSNLPTSLVKLSLNGLGYPWKYMSAIGSLPLLEELKLRCYAFRRPEWEIKDGQFGSLKSLLLEDIDVVHWTVEEEHLPCLRHLIVRHCYKLRMIPYIPQMDRLELDDCPSVEHIERPKNDNLKVMINSSWNF